MSRNVLVRNNTHTHTLLLILKGVVYEHYEPIIILRVFSPATTHVKCIYQSYIQREMPLSLPIFASDDTKIHSEMMKGSCTRSNSTWNTW